MTYDLKPIRAPRVAGGTLRLLTPLVEHPPLGAAITAKLLRDVGISALRKIDASGSVPIGPHMKPGPAASPAEELNGPALAAKVAACDLPQADGFAFESAADFVAAYRTGKTDPVQVAERALEWSAECDRLDPPMRIFISQDGDDVISQAQAAAVRYREGRPLGPLDGVPVVVKDELDQRGYPTTVGTSFLGGEPAAEDATAVARLRAAGAVLLGKANMHEIGLGVTGVNPHHGAARNPYDPARMTSGSSSGPAAAVAAGLCPLAIGADGGGSIRMPASFCGVVGLKPTFGRVSEHGAAPLCWSVAHVGPIAATASDCALGYALMAGADPEDQNSQGRPAPHLSGFGDRDLHGIKLGVYTPWFDDAQPDVVTACRKALDVLRNAGCEIVEIELPELSLLRTVHLVIIVSEMATAHQSYRRGHRKDYACDTRLNLALARRLKATDYIHAQRLRTRLCEHFEHALEGVDAIVTPTTGCTAPEIAKDTLRSGESNLELTGEIMRFAPAANLTGLPAISFPAGYDGNGLPIGLQAMGRAFEEHLLLRLAAAAQAKIPRQEPRLHRSLLD
ncbi:MAG TPA: amidase [Myxococcota bacterium]|nr:amidase [Myxococcota bacterium]